MNTPPQAFDFLEKHERFAPRWHSPLRPADGPSRSRADRWGLAMAIGYKTMPPQPPDYGTGPAVLEFGVDWCSHCRGAQEAIGQVLGGVAGLAHYRIEDGPGRPLGRAFKIKRWPTLVFLHDGREVERLVRPAGADPIREALDKALQPPAADKVAVNS